MPYVTGKMNLKDKEHMKNNTEDTKQKQEERESLDEIVEQLVETLSKLEVEYYPELGQKPLELWKQQAKALLKSHIPQWIGIKDLPTLPKPPVVK